MTEGRQSASIQPQHRSALLQTTWEELREPGAYVEEGSGDLFRVPQEALVTGASPIIARVSNGASRLVRVSENPAVPLMKARMVAADHNIEPNF
ncbi:MAG TPA: hypothetical protein VGL60_00500 [Acidimicrobiales bacterium]|jgi:hypothetical protein